jgi:hypothetical protein
VNSIVLSKMPRHVLSRMPLSCYQKLKREFPSGKIAEFSSLNSSNQENKSSGFILTMPEPVDNRFRRPQLFEWHSSPPSKPNRDWAYINITKCYARMRWISTEIAESRRKPLACECRVGSGGHVSYIKTSEVSDMTSEVSKGKRWGDSRRDVRESQCQTPRLGRRGGLCRPRLPQGGVSVRLVRDRRLGVHIASERAFSVRRRCWPKRIGPIQSGRTARRSAS